MIRITKRAWAETDRSGKRFWVVWKPIRWSHPALARAGGLKRCHQARAILLIPPSAPRLGIFFFNPFRTWNE